MTAETQEENPRNLEIVAPSALEAIQRAEADMAITTAKKYPRDVAQSIKTCRELALRSASIAKTCNYAVPRAGRQLIGPSVHFARIVAYAWGNSTALSRVVGADRQNVHLQGVFHDLQSNVRIGIEMDWPVQPPKTDSPERWADQINLAKRAGAAVALRSAIFNVIPMALFNDIAEEAKGVAVGEGKTFIESRNNAIAAFKAMGVTQEMIYRALGIGGLESITTDHLIYLHAVMTSIKDSAMTVQEVFGNHMDPVKAQVPVFGVPTSGPRRGRPPKQAEQELPVQPGPKAPEPETKPAEPETKPPVPETKPEDKEDLAPFSEPTPKKQAAPPAEPQAPAKASPADKIRARLVQANLTEAELIKWLDDLGTVPAGTASLDTVNGKWLNMVEDDWDGIVIQVKDFLGKGNGSA